MLASGQPASKENVTWAPGRHDHCHHPFARILGLYRPPRLLVTPNLLYGTCFFAQSKALSVSSSPLEWYRQPGQGIGGHQGVGPSWDTVKPSRPHGSSKGKTCCCPISLEGQSPTNTWVSASSLERQLARSGQGTPRQTPGAVGVRGGEGSAEGAPLLPMRAARRCAACSAAMPSQFRFKFVPWAGRIKQPHCALSSPRLP